MEAQNCNGSGDSSPSPRDAEHEIPPAAENPQIHRPQQSSKAKFLCSYGGKIIPRPRDNKLAYLGGETKILAVDRGIKFGDLLATVNALCNCECKSFKYQLPGEDLETLISVTNDDDVEQMMHEFERLCRTTHSSARMRIFVFLPLNPSDRSDSSSDKKTKKEMFVEALNTPPVTLADLESASTAAPPPEHSLPSGKEITLAANSSLQRAVEISCRNENLAAVSDPMIQRHIQDLKKLKPDEQECIQARTLNGEGFNTATEITFNPATCQGVFLPFDNFAGRNLPAPTINLAQPLYWIQPPVTAYHARPPNPIMTTVPQLLPAPGYFTAYQTTPSQQDPHNPTPDAAITAASGGAPAEGGLPPAQAHDSAVARQVIYAAPVPVPVPAAAAEGGGGISYPPAHDSTTERQVIYAIPLPGQASSNGVNTDGMPAVASLSNETAANSTAHQP